MDELLSFVMRLWQIVFASLVVYYDTPEGRQAIDELMAELEAQGYDVPLWTPETGFDLPGLDLSGETAPEARTYSPPVSQSANWQAIKAAARKSGG